MQTFEYKGYDAMGNPSLGSMIASSIDEVERKMLNQQITLVYVRAAKGRGHSPAKGVPGAPSAAPKGRRISDAEGAKILSSLASMTNAGVPFVEALDAILATATREAVIKGVRDLKSQVIEGKSLADALRSARTLFPEVVSDMARVAEEGGSLGPSLASASALLARSADLRRKIKNAMLYPLVMLIVSFLTVIVLVVFVMPKFAEVFSQMHAEIPFTTRMLIDLGVLIRGKPLPCLGGFIGAMVAARYAFRNERVADFLAAAASRLPGIGDLLSKLALSRSLQSVAALISVNVPVVEALEHGAKVADNRALAAAIRTSVASIREGETLFGAFSQHKVIPPAVTQMVGIGERTGNLGTMLATCAAEMETETDARLKSLVSILEPLMIVVMGIVVGMITVSIITPIYAAVQNIR